MSIKNIGSIRPLFAVELVSKIFIFLLSIAVAKTFGASEALDIFTWTLFLFVTINGWLFGTFDFTIIPVFSALSKDQRIKASHSLLLFVICVLLIILPIIGVNYQFIFSRLTDFSADAIDSFHRIFLCLFIYFFVNSVYETIAIILNQAKIYVLPAILRGVVNPIIIITFIFGSNGNLDYYIYGYIISHILILFSVILIHYRNFLPNNHQIIDDINLSRIFILRGFPILGSQILNSISEFLLRYILTGFNVGTLFFYGISSKLVVVINSIFSQTILKVGYTELCALVAIDDEKHKDLYCSLFRSIFLFSMACMVYFMAIADSLIMLFFSGGKIAADQTIMMSDILKVLVIGIVPASLHSLNWKYLSSLNKTMVFMKWAIPNSILSALVIYFFANSVITAAYSEVFLAFYSLLFFSIYVFRVSTFKVTVRSFLFYFYVAINCFFMNLILQNVVGILIPNNIGAIALCTLTFVMLLLFLVFSARLIVPFAFSDLKNMN